MVLYRLDYLPLKKLQNELYFDLLTLAFNVMFLLTLSVFFCYQDPSKFAAAVAPVAAAAAAPAAAEKKEEKKEESEDSDDDIGLSLFD